MAPPLVVDIDGTLTRPDKSLDPRVFDPIREWEAPVVVATGKAFPYPVGLCEFIGIETTIIAENGGIVFVEAADEVAYNGDPEGAAAVAADYREAGHDLGWGPIDPINRWRETELAVSRDQPLDPLVEIAERHGQIVVDTGYAYHIKSPDVDKGQGLESVAGLLGRNVSEFAAVGDSENDAELFECVGRSFAVANADGVARKAADTVTEGSFADGFLEAIKQLRKTT